ncbi:MAG TPA: DNA translocase FtsK [Gammaproteobacteria bacterium]|nr:DNA translocase FtsK [bacterium BMS3Abin11]GMT40066.1 MAG: DNA translocase FtsK [bacterium]HDH15262.1 DNA translocase FtsK [Gammaproteobacteria bacterium]HDZ79001.1 DNA translocase FtsK [Gammaproteobacteria bacterium]
MPQAKRNKSKKKEPVITPKVRAGLRESILFLLTVVAIFLLIALVSFSPQDPGWSHSTDTGMVSNLGGRTGASFANLFLNLFGLMAYLFPIMLLWLVVRIYRQKSASHARDIQTRVIVSVGFLFTLIGGSGLSQMYFNSPLNASNYLAGGYLGGAIASTLIPSFGVVGGTLLLLALFLSGVTLLTGLSWFWLMDITGKYTLLVYDRARAFLISLREKKRSNRMLEQRQLSVKKARRSQEKKKAVRIEPKIARPEQSERNEREKQTDLFSRPAGELLPSLSLLDPAPIHEGSYSRETIETLSRMLERKLLDFNIEVQVVEVQPGPVITRFEIDPAPGIKASQIANLANDLARSLSVISVRVVENIPGKPYMGVEIPNETRESVGFIEGLSSKAYEDASTPLAVLLGKDISGAPVVADLCKMPHLLIAGTTGSGKSVCINALILSIIFKSTPKDVRMILVDPKMLELSVYEGLPHLLAPVVTDMKKAANALRWGIFEMERRYRLMAAVGVRNLAGYNRKVEEGVKQKSPLMNPLVEPGNEPEELTALPHIVIIIDELADLMMVVGKKLEELIARLAQKARAAGIHLVLATQRPSVDVITGLIKANIPSRISFRVPSKIDSRTILDQSGAESLLGLGDMLFLPPGASNTVRVHGAFVSDDEVHRVVKQLTAAAQPEYDETVLEEPEMGGNLTADGDVGAEHDPLYDEAVRCVTESRRASISSVQRKLRVGYNRAARMIETMEMAGVVTAADTSGKREVLAPEPFKD